MNFNWSTNAELFHIRQPQGTSPSLTSRQEVMEATSLAPSARALNILRWLTMVWLRSGKSYTAPTSRSLWRNRSRLAKTPNHKPLVSVPLYLLPRGLWCEVTFPHSPNSPPTNPLLRDNSMFPTWAIGRILFWTWWISSDTLRQVTAPTLGAPCWLELRTHSVRASPHLLLPLNRSVFCACCDLWGPGMWSLEQSYHWSWFALQWMSSAMRKVGLMSHLWLQKSC